MLLGFEVTITQKGHIFTVSGKDVDKLHAKLKSAPSELKNYVAGPLENGAFTLEKMAAAQSATVG